MADLVALSLQLEELLGVPPLVRINGKRPLDRQWSSGPRRNPTGWRRRLGEHNGNVGVLTGDRLVVIDVDLYHPGAEDAVEELHRLGLDRYTVTCLTGGGGRHLYYRAPVPVPSRPLEGFVGIDVKAEGGQVVVPPSVHPDTGRAYEWEFGYAPGDVELALIPANVLELLGVGTVSADTPLDERDEAAVNVLLEHFGGHSPRQRDSYVEVTRPGKPQGASATVGAVGRGTTRVWSTQWPELPAGVYGLVELRRRAGVEQHHQFHIPSAIETVLVPAFLWGSAVTSRRQHWLWDGFLPCGQLVLAVGPEKIGKSTAMVWAAARATRGQLPGDLEGEPVTVAIISAEDDLQTALVPRAMAAGADLHRLAFLDPLGDGFSIGALHELAPRLAILDPLSVYLELNTTNEHGEVAVRRALATFSLLAQQDDMTVVGIRHLRKSATGDNPFDAVLGSRAWSAAPRAVLFLTTDAEQPDRPGGLLFAKGNLARSIDGRRFRLDTVKVGLDDGSTDDYPLFVLEDGVVGINLEEALGPRERVTARSDAETFLREALDGGRLEAVEVRRLAENAGVTDRTLRRAKQALGVVSEREGFGPGSSVYWRLP